MVRKQENAKVPPRSLEAVKKLKADGPRPGFVRHYAVASTRTLPKTAKFIGILLAGRDGVPPSAISLQLLTHYENLDSIIPI